jgi:hypothetical protein
VPVARFWIEKLPLVSVEVVRTGGTIAGAAWGSAGARRPYDIVAPAMGRRFNSLTRPAMDELACCAAAGRVWTTTRHAAAAAHTNNQWGLDINFILNTLK